MAKLNTTINISAKLSKSLQNAFNQLEKKGEGINKTFNAMKTVGVKAADAIAKSFTAVTASMIAVTEATRDYRKDLAKMYNNAELAGVSQKEAWSGLEDLYSLSGEFDSANEAMSNLLATGYKGKDLEKIIEAVNGATIKWQDTVTQESLADAINETVMSGKSIGQFDEILSRSGVRIEEFNDGLLNCSGLAERQQYVLSWLAKSGLTEVNDAYQKQNKSLVDAYNAELAFKNATAELAKVVEPVLTILKNLASQGIGYITEKLKEVDIGKVSDSLQKLGDVGKRAFDVIWQALSMVDWEAVLEVVSTLLSAIVGIAETIVENWNFVSPILAALVAYVVSYKAQMALATLAQKLFGKEIVTTAAAETAEIATKNAATVATAAQTKGTNLAARAQRGLNAAFKANPIGFVISVISTLISIISALWEMTDGFGVDWGKVWEGVKSAVSDAWKFIENIFGKIGDFFDSIGDWFNNLFGGGGTKTIKVEAAKVKKNALGSTITSPTLTWVGEGGDVETIVPHNNKPRSRALALEALRGTGLSPTVVNNQSTSSGGVTFVFSPQISAVGNSSEIKGILDDEMNRFKAQMTEWVKGQRRLSF